MPRTFLNSILNRPSQSYAPPMPPDPTTQPKDKNPANGSWSSPTDLPNAPQQPTSLRQQREPRSSHRYDSISSSVAPSLPPSTTSRSRFGIGKKKSRPSIDGSTFDHDGMSSVYAESTATNTQKKKRWWDTSSLRGFGKSSRSRAGSVAGDSIFSEPPDRPRPQGSMVGVGSKANVARATRSDYGGEAPSSPKSRPPLPENGAAMIRSMSSATGKMGAGVAPLGQSQPALTLNGSKRSKSDLRAAASPPPTSATRRSSTIARQNATSDWASFTQSMSNRDIAKSWTRDPTSKASSGSGGALEKRNSVVDRVRRELEEEAQAEQVARDPGVLHGDLLARAASAVVGMPETDSGQTTSVAYNPTGIRPGSIVAPPPGHLTPQEPHRVSPHAQTVPLPAISQSEMPLTQPAEMSDIPTLPESKQAAVAAEPVTNGSMREPEEISSEDGSEEEEGTSSEDDEGDAGTRDHITLDVVAEEDEDGSSSGGHEMRAGPRSSYIPRMQSRHSAFDSAIGRMSFSSPSSPTSPQLAPSADLRRDESPSLLQSATHATPAIAINDGDAVKRSGSPASPPVPPKPLLAPVAATSQPELASPSSPRQASKVTQKRPELQAITENVNLASDLESPGTSSAAPDTPSAYASANEDGYVGKVVDDDDAVSALSSSSESESEEEETDEESGKDGEIGALARADSPRGVKFEGSHETSDEEDSSSAEEEDVSAARARAKSKGKGRALSQHTDASDTASVRSEETSTRTARNSSPKSSRAPSMQRRLSDMSLGNSFAFSHFMGSKMSGRSSSRRIKLDGDASDSSGEASEEDEELKKLALAEQDRLRNMSVGEDFFGPDLNDVLAQFDKMDFSLPDDEAMKAIAERAQAEGHSQEDSTKAQKEAQNIVSEVRRRRAAGEKDNDGKTLQSEAGGLAASFAALWLLNQGSSDIASVKSHRRDDSKTSTDLASSPSTITASLPSRSAQAPSNFLPRSSSIMDRPRYKVEKPQEMGGITITKGKLTADAVKAPQDERSTLPSLSSFSSSFTTPSSPKSPKRQSIDLGDQKRSKDKPPPSKSALKPKSIRHSKSLADTLFSFSPKKSISSTKADRSEKRSRSNSLVGRASSKQSRDVDAIVDEDTNVKSPRKSSDTTRSFSGIGKKGGKGKERQPNLPPKSPPHADEGGLSSADRSPIKEAGQPEYHSRESSTSTVATDSEAHMPATRYVTAQDLASLAAESSPAKSSVTSVTNRRDRSRQRSQESTSTALSQQTSGATSEEAEQTTVAQNARAGANREAQRATGEIPVPVESEDESEDSPVSTALTLPSSSGVASSAADGKAPISQETVASGEKLLDLPPRPDFSNPTSTSLPSPGEDRTPLATAGAKQPTFGMSLIPPTPPATDGKPKGSAQSGDQKTPTAEVPSPFGGTVADRPGLTRSGSSSSRKTDSSKRNSVRKSAVPDSHGLVLPNGLTATTVASSNSVKRKKSKKSGSGGNSTGQSTHSAASRQSAAPPLPASASSIIASVVTESPPRPAPPPKDVPSRRYSALPLADGGGLAPMNAGFSAASLASLSPPPSTAPSSTGTPERDVSPARSVSGASSSLTSSSASEISDTQPRNQHRARVRTQSAGPSRRPSVMTAISEWDHTPISGHASPVSQPSPVGMTGFESFTPSSVTRSTTSATSGSSPEVVRNAPMGSSTDAYLQPPVPRSRLTMEERQRQMFEAQLNAAGYSRSEGGHGAASVSLSRQSSMSGVPKSVDGHGYTPSGRPQSVMSSMSAVSIPQSVSTLPSVPQSSYRPAKDPLKAAGSSNVDERLYQRSTMATISVSSGAFAKSAKGASKRKGSLDSSTPASDGVARRSSEYVPEHLQDELGLTQMSLTAHTPPPRKIGSRQALVQIIAVAIDEMDRMLLRDKIRSGDAYGWVPGRSFCGRVMEVGWEIKKVRKGDMVFGLQTNRKCGALAEFMTIDEENIAKAPEDCLTVEQIAALPSTGVLALQLVRNYCSGLPRGARILILNAHDGIGLLTMQECAELGLVMVAQCPASISDGVAVCEANGAHEVVIGEPLWAMNTLHESSFDLVVDTIGGRRLYDAARRILASNGQFVTCFGDEHSSANPNFKSHMRSLRRTFFKKDKKNIGYEWIGLENAEDTKECLEAVKNAAERGDICPRLSSVLPFADAPRAFDPVIRGVEEAPGAVVVRVS